MKTVLFLIGALSLSIAHGQQPLPEASRVEPPQVIERGPHHRVWEWFTEAGTNFAGAVRRQRHSYTELATGLHYWTDGGWADARVEFEIIAGQAVARRLAHKVSLAGNPHTAGAVVLELPDASVLRSHVLGLSYYDAASGRSVLIAETQDTDGQIVAPDQVLYTNAFTDFRCDLRYKVTRFSFEQDIILRQRPPAPQEFGLDPETTRLAILTEFLNPPFPPARRGHRWQASRMKRLISARCSPAPAGPSPATAVRLG